MLTAPAAAAGTWSLGDRTVNRLGFGAMRVSQRGRAFADDAVPRDRDDAIAVLRRAVELGVNHVDTAAFYFSSRRSANELINAALRPYPEDLTIVTKVGPSRDASGEWGPAGRPDQLRGQVEENLRQLGRDRLDVVNYRRQRGAESVAEHVGALAALCDEGLIGHVGVSGVTAGELLEARGVAPIVCVQNNFSLARRVDHNVLELCGELGVAFVPFFAIAASSGHRGAWDGVPDVVREVAQDHEATSSQILLAWTLHQGPHVLAIPGTGELAHLEENVAAASIRLDDGELARLAASSETSG